MNDHLRFLAAFARNPFSVGAIAPSSRWLASRMIRQIDLETARTVVELGPGTGAFTRLVAEHLAPKTLFLAVELDPRFARELARRFPRAVVVHDSAERLDEHLKRHGRDHADSVLCGLPWASFPRERQERILDSVLRSLRPGGRFATFAYVHAAWLPAARRFSRLLESRFSRVERTPVVWRNLPPAFVYRSTR